MSHVSSMKLAINDLDALDKACKALGLELVRDQKTFRWFGRWMNDFDAADAAYRNGIDVKDYGKCEHAIRIPGNSNAYEVGIMRNKEGQLVPVWDFFCGGYGLEEKIGKNGSKLKHEYNLQVGMKQMLKKGFKVERRVNPVTKKPQMRAWRSV